MEPRSVARWALSTLLLAGAGGALALPPLTVGPHGAYRTLQAALTAAAPLAGPVDVRLERGVFGERVVVGVCCTGSVTVSGGWDATFTARSTDPSLSIVDGRSLGRPMDLRVGSGALTLYNLTLANGLLHAEPFGLPSLGGGLHAVAGDTGSVTLHNVHVRGNRISASGPGDFEGQGGGAFVSLNGSASVLIQACTFESNALLESDGANLNSHGGGLELQVFGGRATIINSVFRANVAGGSDVAVGGGLSLLVQDASGLGAMLVANLFERNRVAVVSGAAGADLGAFGGHGGPNIVVRRNLFRHNIGFEQVRLSGVDGGRVDLSDTLVYGGDRDGVHAYASAGKANLTNVTAADNAAIGVYAQALRHGEVSVFNSIAFGNHDRDLVLLGDRALQGFNLEGVDPLFRNIAAGDYRLRPESPARDAGINAPPGGLGPADLGAGPRVVSGVVDIGADEID